MGVHRVPCRLCGEEAEPTFRRTLLGRHEIQYFACKRCGSLQTEAPFWLDEAYAGGSLGDLDTGAAQRNLDNLAMVWMLARALRANDILDFGGGDGLLCRLLRDHGFNCFVKDEYANASYARPFAQATFDRPDLILMFEVLEHLPSPRDSLDRVFSLGARAIIATTQLYSGQDESWWYLVPEGGQHVFFYGRHGLEQVAALHGYTLITGGGYLLFLRDRLATQRLRAVLWLLMKRPLLTAARGITGVLPAKGVAKDFADISRRLKAAVERHK